MSCRSYSQILTILTSEPYQGLSVEQKWQKFRDEENLLPPPPWQPVPFPLTVNGLASVIEAAQTCD